MLYNFKYKTINRFSQSLEDDYKGAFGELEPIYGNYVNWIGRLALENIANSDMLYHDIEHTMLVTTVGQQILLGKHLTDGGISPREWAHFITALLCHDIGYVRGVCRLDGNGVCATGVSDDTVTLDPEGTDAQLTPYHVDRSKQFIRERFGTSTLVDIDAERVCEFIEMTRFPVPVGEPAYQVTDSFAGLVRAADFIGQLGDPDYLRKIPALFYEFEQLGTNAKIGYKSPTDMRRGFATFFWKEVSPYIQQATRYLQATQDGNQWLANLHSHVFQVEHADH
ncbi:MAG: metal-dependent phosphohydrolase [Gemmatimonadetes bacterium]|jgi:hypothetical protein|nr:metal-dependent phosphohydrolase [Gemmatimonadota bacterium]MBT5057851.1 metal-dependent phosphohydrolase [Gemmatimonadota bacterium]MBT5144555.1 metal-dependent phosphohydrolase [Gemmatimonadota bacterium]MBT5591120.1 metal-dependent phosphohydrolase [Gemmatimonadota bacterium]MBT5962814.1 metal-dependent phosphohydrolase [Gemmatimonadota bacterium]